MPLGALIVVLLISISLLAGGRWWVGRAFPQVSGTLQLAGLEGVVEVRRDKWGVPHIYASTRHDLFFTQGVVHAQDRLWQMDYQRRVGLGRLSEFFGQPTVESDRFWRTMGIAQAVQRDWQALSAEGQAALKAYAAGINAYMSRQPVLPLEYQVLGVEWEPWEPLHTLAVLKVMQWRLDSNSEGNWQEELLRAQLIEQIGHSKAALLLADDIVFDSYLEYQGNNAIPHLPLAARTATLPSPPYLSSEVGRPLAASDSMSYIRCHTPSDSMSYIRCHTPSDSMSYPLAPMTSNLSPPRRGGRGSTGWVIGGEHTSSGHPILVSTLPLEGEMPSLWYELGLHGAGLEVVGAGLPGAVGVFMGHNASVAWGMSNLGSDQQDLFIERLNESEDAYQWQGQMLPLTVRREVIRVKDSPDVALEVKESRHGALLNEVIDGLELPIALQWGAIRAPTPLVDALLAINLAQSADEMLQALRLWHSPAQLFIFADGEGNIGTITAGDLPRRPAAGALLPQPGWTGEWEWQGIMPFEALPQAWNPPEGYLIAPYEEAIGEKNRKGEPPEPPSFPATRISAMIEQEEALTLDEIEALQRDVTSLPAQKLVPLLIKLPSDDIIVQRAQAQLRAWNYQMAGDLPGATIYAVTRQQLLRQLLADEFPDSEQGRETLETYLSYHHENLILLMHLLDEPSHFLWDDSQTEPKEKRDDILLRALTEATDWLGRRYGDVPHEWAWNRLHIARFEHPLGTNKPLARIFNRAISVDGDSDTVNASYSADTKSYNATHIASYRQLIDVGAWENSRMLHSTGQSGQPFHPHYDDMMEAWRDVKLLPMLWSDEQTKEASQGRVLKLVP